MKKFGYYIGITFILLGTLALIATRIPSLTSSNVLLISGLLLIVAGIMLHIRHIKHQSNY
jgi:uncharacterized membrane protein HdeD (DUF308 family)